MAGIGIILLFILTFCSCSGSTKNPGTGPYSLETLIFLEEVHSDVWENTGARESALSRLRYVCRNLDTDDGFLCFTWGLLEYRRGNYSESYTAFKKALEKNPDDTLYKSMLRLSAEKSGNLTNLANSGEEGKTMSLYSETFQSCTSETKKAEAFPNFLALAKEGHITKDMLKRGVMAACFTKFSEQEKSEVSPFVPEARIRYADRLASDREKSDPFSKVWDTSYFHKGNELKDSQVYSRPISEAWRKLKMAAKAGNETQARESLKQFLKESASSKKKGKTEASLALALERSAKLLIEQDPAYVKVNFLAKEF